MSKFTQKWIASALSITLCVWGQIGYLPTAQAQVTLDNTEEPASTSTGMSLDEQAAAEQTLNAQVNSMESTGTTMAFTGMEGSQLDLTAAGPDEESDTASAPNPSSKIPVAHSITVNTDEDQAYSGQLQAENEEQDPLTFLLNKKPEHGTAKIGTDGIFTYTPDENYNGQDSFTFNITTSTVDGIEDVVTNRPMPWEVVVSEKDGSVYWIEDVNTSARIMKSNADGSNIKTIMSFGRGLESGEGQLTLDEAHGKIYFVDYVPQQNRIRSMNMDGTGIETLRSNVGSISLLQYHETTNQLFWRNEGAIKSYELDNPEAGVTTVIAKPDWTEGLINTFAIAGEKIYLNMGIYDSSQPDAHTHKFKSANLDGSNVVTLMSSAPRAATLAVNAEREILYWVEAGGHSIKKMVIGEETITTLVEEASAEKLVWDIDFHKGSNSLHWVDLEQTGIYKGAIKRIGLGVKSEAASVEINIAPVNDAPIVKRAPKDMMLKEGGSRTLAFEQIFSDEDGDNLTYGVFVADENGHELINNTNAGSSYDLPGTCCGEHNVTLRATDPEGAVTEAHFVMTVAKKPVAHSLTVNVNEDQIYSGQLNGDGSEPMTFLLDEAPKHGTVELALDGRYTYTPHENYFGQDGFTFHVETDANLEPGDFLTHRQLVGNVQVNETDGTVYWLENDETIPSQSGIRWNKIMRADADGTNVKIISKVMNLWGQMTLDPLHGKIYFAGNGYLNSGPYEIASLNMDGTDWHTVTREPNGVYMGTALQYDETTNRLFWFNNRGEIKTFNLNNPDEGITTVIARPSLSGPYINSFTIGGGKIYWFYGPRTNVTSDDRYKATLMSANLDGTDRKVLLDNVTAGALVVDSISETLYWVDRTIIQAQRIKALVLGEKAAETILQTDWDIGSLHAYEGGGQLYWSDVQLENNHLASNIYRMRTGFRFASEPAEITMKIAPVNDPPFVKQKPQDSALVAGATRPLKFEQFFGDVDGDKLIYGVLATDENGEELIHADNVGAVYDLPGTCCGKRNVTLYAADPDGVRAQTEFSVTVFPAPKAFPINIDMREDEVSTGQLQGEGPEPLTFHLAEKPKHGKVAVGLDGSYTYTPDKDFNGQDTFTFYVKPVIEKNVQEIVADRPGPSHMVVDETDGSMYWYESQNNTMVMMRADADGSNIDRLFELNNFSYGNENLALDSEGGKIYFTALDSEGSLRIMSLHLDGTDLQALPLPTGETGEIKQLQYDASSHQLFWFNSGYGIQSYNPGSPDTGIQVIMPWPADRNLGRLYSFAVRNGKIYWNTNYAGHSLYDWGLWRSNLDGSDKETLLVGKGNMPPTRQMIVSPGNDELYWITQPRGSYGANSLVKFVIGEQAVTTIAAGVNTQLLSSLYLNQGNSTLYWTQYATQPPFAGGIKSLEVSVASDPAEATILITPVNDAPIAVKYFDDLKLKEAGTHNLKIDDAFRDVDGDTLTLHITLRNAAGEVLLDLDNVTSPYALPVECCGVTGVELRATDPYGAFAVTKFKITVGNTAPHAEPGTLVTDEDISGRVYLSGTDDDGDAVTFKITKQPLHGALSEIRTEVAGDGTERFYVVYMPEPDYNGSDIFEYAAHDGFVDSKPAAVNINIHPINDAPMVRLPEPPDLKLIRGGRRALTFDMIFRDIDDLQLTYSVTITDLQGKILLQDYDVKSPYYVYGGEPGTTIVTLSARDPHEAEAQTKFKITVDPDKVIAPVAYGQKLKIHDGEVYTGQLQASGTGPLTFHLDKGPAHGTVVVNPDGSFTYTPENGYTGEDIFTFYVSSGISGGIEKVVQDQLRPREVVVDESNGVIYWIKNGQDLMRADSDGAYPKVVTRLTDSAKAGNLVLDDVHDRFYFSDDSCGPAAFCSVDKTGGDLQLIPIPGSAAEQASHLQYDAPTHHLFWLANNEFQIKSIDLDDPGRTVKVVAGWIPDEGPQRSFAIGGDRIFWFTLGDNLVKLKSANLDGSDPRVLLDSVDYGSNMVVDVNGKTLYWTAGDGSIKKLRIGETVVETVVPASENDTVSSLYFFKAGGTIYWTDETGTTGSIKRLVPGMRSASAAIGFNILPVNNPPIIKQNPADVSMMFGEIYSINLSDIFEDPDGDPLTYALVGLDNAGNILFERETTDPGFTFANLPEGEIQVTLRATDPTGDFAQTAFNLTVEPGGGGINLPPRVVNMPGDLTLKEGDVFTLDLGSIFSDPEGAPLTYSVTGEDEDNGSIFFQDDNAASLYGIFGQCCGVIRVTLHATDPEGEFVETSFHIVMTRRDIDPGQTYAEWVAGMHRAFDTYKTENPDKNDLGLLIGTQMEQDMMAHEGYLRVIELGDRLNDAGEQVFAIVYGSDSKETGQTYAEWENEMQEAFESYPRENPGDNTLVLLIGTQIDQDRMPAEGYVRAAELGDRLNDRGEQVFAVAYRSGSDYGTGMDPTLGAPPAADDPAGTGGTAPEIGTEPDVTVTDPAAGAAPADEFVAGTLENDSINDWPQDTQLPVVSTTALTLQSTDSGAVSALQNDETVSTSDSAAVLSVAGSPATGTEFIVTATRAETVYSKDALASGENGIRIFRRYDVMLRPDGFSEEKFTHSEIDFSVNRDQRIWQTSSFQYYSDAVIAVVAVTAPAREDHISPAVSLTTLTRSNGETENTLRVSGDLAGQWDYSGGLTEVALTWAGEPHASLLRSIRGTKEDGSAVLVEIRSGAIFVNHQDLYGYDQLEDLHVWFEEDAGFDTMTYNGLYTAETVNRRMVVQGKISDYDPAYDYFSGISRPVGGVESYSPMIQMTLFSYNEDGSQNFQPAAGDEVFYTASFAVGSSLGPVLTPGVIYEFALLKREHEEGLSISKPLEKLMAVTTVVPGGADVRAFASGSFNEWGFWGTGQIDNLDRRGGNYYVQVRSLTDPAEVSRKIQVFPDSSGHFSWTLATLFSTRSESYVVETFWAQGQIDPFNDDSIKIASNPISRSDEKPPYLPADGPDFETQYAFLLETQGAFSGTGTPGQNAETAPDDTAIPAEDPSINTGSPGTETAETTAPEGDSTPQDMTGSPDVSGMTGMRDTTDMSGMTSSVEESMTDPMMTGTNGDPAMTAGTGSLNETSGTDPAMDDATAMTTL